ncbi:hypothetical protein, partial [Bacillus subtilis]|uniref:hypothetical protein n=1 Tax=Bacillus subtilis TaxID=1423 RepID=UPI002078B5D6
TPTKPPLTTLSRLVTIPQYQSAPNPNSINLSHTNPNPPNPSQPLIHTLPTTFNPHKPPPIPNITNPIHNPAPPIDYIKSTYRSIHNLPPIKTL